MVHEDIDVFCSTHRPMHYFSDFYNGLESYFQFSHLFFGHVELYNVCSTRGLEVKLFQVHSHQLFDLVFLKATF
jgi:hypothetical protein